MSATLAPAPTPAEQIAFLGNIERLLSEGQFVATYKYALLIAIADLAVELGACLSVPRDRDRGGFVLRQGGADAVG